MNDQHLENTDFNDSVFRLLLEEHLHAKWKCQSNAMRMAVLSGMTELK